MSEMKTYNINEIFYSLQGEGFHTGKPAIFIRFAGCNLKCWFCDTNHEHGIEMTIEQIYNKISQYPSKHIVLTGGEPTLQVDEDITTFLKEKGYYLQIETNGTHKIPPLIDWVTCSPKTYVVLDYMDELKLVYTGQDISQFENMNAKHFYLQPCDGADNTNKVISIIKNNPKWRLSLQIHKLLNIR